MPTDVIANTTAAATIIREVTYQLTRREALNIAAIAASIAP